MSEPLTEAELAAIKARCAAASPGPWTWDTEGRDNGDVWLSLWADPNAEFYPGIGGSAVIRADVHSEGAHELVVDPRDQAFIAAAREDVSRLVAEIERLHAASASTDEAAFSAELTKVVLENERLRLLLIDRQDELHWQSGNIAHAPRADDHDLSGGWRACRAPSCVEAQRALGITR